MRTPYREMPQQEALMGVACPKELPSITEILSARPRTREYGSTRLYPPWLISFQTDGLVVRAQLQVHDLSISSLDFHRLPSGKKGTPNRLPAGYHWDIRPPLDRERREWIDPQPADVTAAMLLLRERWNVRYADDLEQRMRP